MLKKHSKFLIPGIIVIGMVLRIPFTSIPPIISHIAKTQYVPVGQLGILTTIPLIAFAIFSSIAPKTAEKLGLERTFAVMLIVMVVGSWIRIINTPLLYIGTLLIGVGIAHMNVLLPSVIRLYFPNKVGPMTSTFTFSMMLATAVGAGLSAPIAEATHWHVFILLLTTVIGIAFLVWLPNVRFAAKHPQSLATTPTGVKRPTNAHVWRNRYAWLLLYFAGVQSAMFYILMAWGPTMAIQTGLSASVASVFAGINALIGLPFALTVPTIVARLSTVGRQWLVGVSSVIGIVGYLLLLVPNNHFGYWLSVNLLIGVSTSILFPYLMTTFSLKTTTPIQTAELSGMAQSGGYVIAALGPALFGYGYSWFHSWVPQIVVMIILFILMTIAIFLVEKQHKILS